MAKQSDRHEQRPDGDQQPLHVAHPSAGRSIDKPGRQTLPGRLVNGPRDCVIDKPEAVPGIDRRQANLEIAWFAWMAPWTPTPISFIISTFVKMYRYGRLRRPHPPPDGPADHERPLSLHGQLLPLDPGRSHLQSPCATGLEGDERGQPARPARCIRGRSPCWRAKAFRPRAATASRGTTCPLTPDIVVTVCSSAAGKPARPTLDRCCAPTGAWTTRRTRPGTDAEIDAAFVSAYRILRTRIEAFLALPLAELAAATARV